MNKKLNQIKACNGQIKIINIAIKQVILVKDAINAKQAKFPEMHNIIIEKSL